MIQYTLSTPSDLDAIIHLLMVNKLPWGDIPTRPVVFWIARDAETIVGCIGIEKYGKNGLLRSFAVHPEMQNKGIGKELYKKLVQYAGLNGITSLHLLTETACDYFTPLGYKRKDRNEAPPDMKNTSEFTYICPVSSAYMVLNNVMENAL